MDYRNDYRERHGIKQYMMEAYEDDVKLFKKFKESYPNKHEAFKALMELAVEKGLCKAPSP